MMRIRIFYRNPEDRQTVNAVLDEPIEGSGVSKYDAIYDLLHNKLGIEVAGFPEYKIIDARRFAL